ncbi:MAG: glycoside hydrolase family 3 C-terminal domain-containing protein [Clostridium sp.]|nr:glycoside hydrolase family 3 C-terminal domain-containing protein [Clostridium sp.]
MNKIRIEAPEVQAFETEHIAVVRKVAPECMVLLKNDGTLPLKGAGKLALYGSGARKTIKGGTGSGDVNVRHFVTVEEGLENAGFEITTKSWLDGYDKKVADNKAVFYGALRKEAEAAGLTGSKMMLYAMGRTPAEPEYELPLDGEGDTAVYVLARISGEGADRAPVAGDINLTETEIRDILALNEKYEKFVLVLNVGGMIDLKPVEAVENILLLGQLGSATGDALADVLLGKAYPSGKLTMTWAPIKDYASTEGFGDPNDTYYKEGIYVGYRYFDTIGYTPTYPFGYGLGYTTFTVEPKGVTADASKISVNALVTNTGSAAGKEIVQVYYSAPAGKLDKPYQELAGYAKTKELAPGESQEVTVTFDTESMASYCTECASYVMEAGTYFIRVGNHSRNTHIAGAVRLDGLKAVEKDKNICGDSGFEDYKPEGSPITYDGEEEEKAGAKVIDIKAADLAVKETVYQEVPEEIPAGPSVKWDEVVSGVKTLDEFVAGLSDEQLAYLCVGEYKDADDLMEVIGNASSTVAGAAGETTQRLKELGVPVLVMADGPAGLRLAPTYKQVGGAAKATSSNMGGDFMAMLTPEEIKAMSAAAPEPSEEEKAAPTNYQYCVAIPIGTGLAQSWNDELVKKCGDLVGEEMEMFGTHLWLAPAMNIYRSPLCGRNFEYYSEDPHLSGCIAADITDGVQIHEGCATTIKHYACNNQETNRYFSNSNVGERALREIYLKGFEICVKKSQPHFIMTSYNLINGEHACSTKDIQTATLRDEWGFAGVVMTDWLVTGGMGAKGEKWPCASCAGNVKAGNDITMPGIPSDKADIMKALTDESHPYALSRAELQLSVKRVLGMILKLA